MSLTVPVPGDCSLWALSKHIRALEILGVRYVSGPPPQIHVIFVTNTGAPSFDLTLVEGRVHVLARQPSALLYPRTLTKNRGVRCSARALSPPFHRITPFANTPNDRANTRR